jgi:predicted small lipoprotein YifL
MKRALRALALAGVATSLLAACGVRGSLELPPEAKAAESRTATAESGQGKPAGAAPKPHKPFLLDGLIR